LSNFFITGASGFIGKKLVNALNSNLDSITIVSRNPQSEYKTIVCDLESEILPENSLKGIDIVFHLAGLAHDSSSSKEKYYNLNVKATIQLAKMAAKSGVKNFIFISSIKASNVDYKKDTHESYGKTKRDAEIQLLSISSNSNLKVSIIRPSLVYGPSVKGNLNQMLSGIKSGWFPPVPEINNRKSMVHVDDLINAIILVAKDNSANNKTLVVSDGNSYSTREIYETLCMACGKSIPKWHVPLSFFLILTFLNRKMGYKVNKLLGDDYFPTSDAIINMGYSPKKSLKDINFSEY
jgi:nucleoside-diphosphate-sugar epimerase